MNEARTISARIVARNLYAKYSRCTRQEAERVLEKVSNEVCFDLSQATPEEAEQMVKRAVVQSARQIVDGAAKEPSQEAVAGLLDVAEKKLVENVSGEGIKNAGSDSESTGS